MKTEEVLDNFVITIKKDKKFGNLYFAICEQFFTENVVCSLMGAGKTVEGALLDFIKELKAQRETLCVRGKAMEGKVAKAVYEKCTEERKYKKMWKELKNEDVKNIWQMEYLEQKYFPKELKYEKTTKL